jgi:phage gp45-like
MHRATPQNVAHRSYTAGGARGVAGKVDDSKLMQEITANFMAGEERSKIEAPQNYGFTSHHMAPDADGSGAEHFSSFIGGARSFPVAGVIDDRRHRLIGLDEGDVAMYRTKDDQLQFHLAQDGGYLTGPDSKKLRMQLISGQQSGSQGSGSSQGGSAQGGAASGGAQKPTGQKPVNKQDSSQYTEVNGTMTVHVNKQHQVVLQDKNTGIEVNPDNNVYLGAIKGSSARSGSFLPVMLKGGQLAKNVFGLVGGGSDDTSSQWVDANNSQGFGDAPSDGQNNMIAALTGAVQQLASRVEALEAALAAR